MASKLTHCTSRFVAWYLLGLSGCASPILYSTVNSIVRDDSEERALILVRIKPCPTMAKATNLTSMLGSYDDFRLQLQHLGASISFSNGRNIRSPEMATWLASLVRLLALTFRWVYCSNRVEQARVRIKIPSPRDDDNIDHAYREKRRNDDAGDRLQDGSSEEAVSIEVHANEKTN